MEYPENCSIDRTIMRKFIGQDVSMESSIAQGTDCCILTVLKQSEVEND
jgi:hypothetical protein